MVFGLGMNPACLLISDVLLNKVFNLSELQFYQLQKEVNIGYFVRWLWCLEIISIKR